MGQSGGGVQLPNAGQERRFLKVLWLLLLAKRNRMSNTT